MELECELARFSVPTKGQPWLQRGDDERGQEGSEDETKREREAHPNAEMRQIIFAIFRWYLGSIRLENPSIFEIQ